MKYREALITAKSTSAHFSLRWSRRTLNFSEHATPAISTTTHLAIPHTPVRLLSQLIFVRHSQGYLLISHSNHG